MPEREGSFRLVGRLAVYDIPLEPRGGLPLLLFQDNVVTRVGKEHALKILAGQTTDYVKNIAIGDGGVVPGPPRLLDVPVAADRLDTALGNLVAEKVASVALAFGGNVPEIIFTAEFFTVDSPLTFDNPSEPVINEAGLRTTLGVLFARRTFPSIPFDVGDRLGIRLIWHVGAL